MELNFFAQLALIILAATFLGLILSKLKQPLILAYIFTGILLSGSFLNVLAAKEMISVFSELGIAFLLFLVGLHLDINVFRDIGRTSIITGLGQIFFTLLIGFTVASLLGFPSIVALYIAVGLSFSSTIIIVKFLSDKNELNSLHGKISIGFLLVQDVVAIIALIFVSSINISLSLPSIIFSFFFKGIIFFLFVAIISRFFLEKLFDQFAKSQELLFLASLSWLLLLSITSQLLGFSIEIGAFIAGITLGSLPYTFEIAGKVKYLRDFFLVLFFVLLGSQLLFASIESIVIPAIIFSLIVLIGNPMIVTFLMLLLGHRGKTAFLSALAVAQVSEFSLVLAALGVKVGHLPESILAILTMVALMTIAISSYLISFNHSLYRIFSSFLERFASKKSYEDKLTKLKFDHHKIKVVLAGFNRTGRSIIHDLKLDKKSILVIDLDPAMIKKAISEGFNTFYGDIEDFEVIEFINSCMPEILISTTKDFEANKILLFSLSKEKKPFTIVLTESIAEAKELYRLKADLVIVPAILAGKNIREYVHAVLESKEKLKKIQEEFISDLRNF